MNKTTTLLIALALLLIAPASVCAMPVQYPDGSVDTGRFALWTAQAKVALPASPVVIDPRGCPPPGDWDRSCALPFQNTLRLLNTVPGQYNSPFVFYHELGHLVDAHMDASYRVTFAHIVGDHRAWFDGDIQPHGAAAVGTPPLDEWFADVYARCAQWGDTVRHNDYIVNKGIAIRGYGQLYHRPRDLRAACGLMRSIVTTPHYTFDAAFANKAPVWPA